MTNPSPWDDPELKNGDFYDFEVVGSTASGRITFIGIHRWDDGKVSPQLKMVDDTSGEDRTLTAKQMQLKGKLVELRPAVGDHLFVKYTHDEKRDGGKKTLKCFDVVINGGGGAVQATAHVAAVQAAVAAPVVAAPVAEAAPVTPAAPPVDLAAAAAALGLDATQLAALQNLQPQG